MTNKANIRIVDIAKMAGVSVGTVDRVLHNRGRVSKEKKEKVEEILKKINYEPNMVARLLASKHQYVLAAVIPAHQEGDYWNAVNKGIDRAANELKKFNVTIEYFYFDQYNKNSFLQTIAEIETQKFDGVIIATLFGEQVVQLSSKLDEKEIPYIYIDSNIPGQNNLTYFGADSFTSGMIAAKLMMKEINSDSNIIIGYITNKQEEISTQMRNREAGFENYLRETNFRGKVHRINLTSSDTVGTMRTLEKIFDDNKNVTGGIVFNSRIYELVSLLNRIQDSKSKISLIGYDAIQRNVEAIKSGNISYIIAQHSRNQGYDSIKYLSNYLLFKQTGNKVNHMPIDILIKENIDYYNYEF